MGAHFCGASARYPLLVPSRPFVLFDAVVHVVVFCVCFLPFVQEHGVGAATAVGTATATNTRTQKAAVRGLLSRRLPAEAASQFDIELLPVLSSASSPADVFEIANGAVPGRILVRGSSGTAIAAGINHYLKYYCNVSISWETLSSPPPRVPLPLPHLAQSPLRIETQMRLRYYMNVCTHQYSHGWYQWDDWERDLDWAALQGINMPLALTGYEYLFRELFVSRLGLKDVDDFLAGAAFGAWQVMGNIQGDWTPASIGQTLPESWIKERFVLLQKILARARSFGMTPVLPAFAGHVPKTFGQYFPKANLSKSADWNSFSQQFCCDTFLEPTDPLFRQVGAMFIKVLEDLVGTDHYYNGDLFNEMRPRSSDPSYIAQTTRAMIDAITDADPHGVWVMQGWLFYNERDFWQPAQVQACLEAAPVDRLVVLDLYAENYPIWKFTDSFYGRPFIWNMLLNFGGRPGLIGNASAIAVAGPRAAVGQASSMVGLGITMEAIGTNYVMYDLALEMAWQPVAGPLSPLQLEEWFVRYSVRRYGQSHPSTAAAWRTLLSSAYSFDGPAPPGALEHRPSLTEGVPFPYAHSGDIRWAFASLMDARDVFANVPTFLYDAVDLKRQILMDEFVDLRHDFISAFSSENRTAFLSAAAAIRQALADMEKVLALDEHFSLRRWLEAAQSWARFGRDPAADVRYFTYQAKNQLTLWGPRGEISDYAAKHWAGLVSSYYRPRWEIYLTCMLEVLDGSAQASQKEPSLVPPTPDTCETRVQDFELAWQVAPYGEELGDDCGPARQLSWAEKMHVLACA